MNVAMSIKSRGVAASAARAVNVVSRFGATVSPMARRLERYLALTSELGFRPTWPATACVVDRHPDVLRDLAARGAEIALHGLVHGDHATQGVERQRDSIARARDIFDRHGLRPDGFRGPYLRYNAATLVALSELGIEYHSSQAVFYPPPGGGRDRVTDAYRRAIALYGALDARTIAVRPRIREGLVDIPIALPDDEILVERLGSDETSAEREWLHLLELTLARGDLLTVQLHPERLGELEGALRTLLGAARRRGGVWPARLDEIAGWWMRREGFRLHVTRTTSGHRVHVEADPDATILVRGAESTREPWSARDSVLTANDVHFRSERAPIVGVSPSSPREVRSFIREEGFQVEVADDASRFGAFVDAAGGWTETAILEAIESAPGPLVRIWRWPSRSRSALAVTGDIDALTLQDFALRFWETRETQFRGWRT